jgi:hypothetical protein
MTNIASADRPSSVSNVEKFSRYDIEVPFCKCAKNIGKKVLNVFIDIGNFFARAEKFSHYQLDVEAGKCMKNLGRIVANLFIDLGNLLSLKHGYNLCKRRVTRHTSEESASPTVVAPPATSAPAAAVTPTSAVTTPSNTTTVPAATAKRKFARRINSRSPVSESVSPRDTSSAATSLREPIQVLQSQAQELGAAQKSYRQRLDEVVPGAKPLPPNPTHFTREEVALLHFNDFLRGRQLFVETFKQANGRDPTEEEFREVFSKEKIKEMKQARMQFMEKADIGERKKIRELITALKTPKQKPKRSAAKTALIATSGLIAGVGAYYFGTMIGDTLAYNVHSMFHVLDPLAPLQPLSQDLPLSSLGSFVVGSTIALGSAIGMRTYNWYKSSKTAKSILSSQLTEALGTKSAKTVGNVFQKCVAFPVIALGAAHYYSNPYNAVTNEIKAVARNYGGITALNWFKDKSVELVAPKREKEKKEGASTFDMSYGMGQMAAMGYLVGIPMAQAALSIASTYPLHIAAGALAMGTLGYLGSFFLSEEEASKPAEVDPTQHRATLAG